MPKQCVSTGMINNEPFYHADAPTVKKKLDKEMSYGIFISVLEGAYGYFK